MMSCLFQLSTQSCRHVNVSGYSGYGAMGPLGPPTLITSCPCWCVLASPNRSLPHHSHITSHLTTLLQGQTANAFARHAVVSLLCSGALFKLSDPSNASFSLSLSLSLFICLSSAHVEGSDVPHAADQQYQQWKSIGSINTIRAASRHTDTAKNTASTK